MTPFKTSQILETLNADSNHNYLCEVILFYESEIIMQITTLCSGVNEMSTVMG
jgi:hypothetical protein